MHRKRSLNDSQRERTFREVVITRPALHMLMDYLKRSPEVGMNHPIEPLDAPREFFLEELHEPDHWLVLKQTVANNGLVTPKIMHLWISQSIQRHLAMQRNR